MTTRTPDLQTLWTARARAALVGRRIVAVRYITDAEAAKSSWRCRPLAIAQGLTEYYSS